ncbi:MAG: hypothetical protein CM1200mP27_00540 [Chloroflexota bacterium]|nr:MAG: hypothetical protein CM1200mP27_00540 [Chloroflexota bacterium]
MEGANGVQKTTRPQPIEPRSLLGQLFRRTGSNNRSDVGKLLGK